METEVGMVVEAAVDREGLVDEGEASFDEGEEAVFFEFVFHTLR